MQRGIRIGALMLMDIVLVNLSYIISFLVKSNMTEAIASSVGVLTEYLSYWFVLTLIKIVIFCIFRLYNSVWKYASGKEAFRVLGALVISNIICGGFLLIFFEDIQKSLLIITFAFDIILIGGIRILYKLANRGLRGAGKKGKNSKNALVVGTGDLAAAVINEIRIHSGEMNIVPVAVVDDNKGYRGSYISGIKVEGGRRDITRLVRKYKAEYIYIALNGETPDERDRIVSECEKTNCRVRIIPDMGKIVQGKIGTNSGEGFDIEEILGAKNAEINDRSIAGSIENRIVMVTGASGVLGVEICKELVKYQPKRLVLLDTDEDGLYNLHINLRNSFPEIEINSVMCPVADVNQLRDVFGNSKPHVVIHTGLYKNIDMMEMNPREAVRNNIFGTINLINECENNGAEKFVLVSSNKAMYTENVFGVVYKINEMLISLRGKSSKTINIAVRIGNIIEEKDSIISRMSVQLEKGEPLTISHSEAVKPFIRANAAAKMILQAMSVSEKSSVFAVGLGWSIMIKDLAEYMIRHSGMKLNEDAIIRAIGLSVGERIFENLLPDEDEAVETAYQDLYLLKKEDMNIALLEKGLSNLWSSVRSYDNAQVRVDLGKIVPGYVTGNQE